MGSCCGVAPRCNFPENVGDLQLKIFLVFDCQFLIFFDFLMLHARFSLGLCFPVNWFVFSCVACLFVVFLGDELDCVSLFPAAS